jgi:hypothetical protein
MEYRGLAAGPLVLLVARVGCASRAIDPTEDVRPGTEEREVPLDLNVDRVDVVHGALRLSATMRDGSADVSISLWASCPPREVGGGIATPSGLVWTFAARSLSLSVDGTPLDAEALEESEELPPPSPEDWTETPPTVTATSTDP